MIDMNRNGFVVKGENEQMFRTVKYLVQSKIHVKYLSSLSNFTFQRLLTIIITKLYNPPYKGSYKLLDYEGKEKEDG